LNESSEGLTDRSDQEGTQEEMDDFETELDSISSPESNGKTTVRNLNPGVSADDLLDKAPGKGRDDGRKDTAEGGNTGTHSSTKTEGNPKTLDVNRPNQRPKKYREQK